MLHDDILTPVKRLFLTSKGITEGLVPYFVGILKNKRHNRKIPKGYLIENASDYKGPGGQEKLRAYYQIIKENGIEFDYLDLKKYVGKQDELDEKLNEADFVYVSGGNTFYLHYYVVKSGFKNIIQEQVNNGLLFASSSAGSVIAGPTIKYIDKVDKIEVSPDPNDIEWEGLNLVNFVILPHWEEEKYKERFEMAKNDLENDGFQVKTLTNKQAFIVNDDKIELVEE